MNSCVRAGVQKRGHDSRPDPFLALVAVADDVLLVPPGLADVVPLLVGPDAGPAHAAEVGDLERLDDRVGVGVLDEPAHGAIVLAAPVGVDPPAGGRAVGRLRPEIVFEGTSDASPDDDADWRAYEFPCKPGDVMRRPCVVAPYQYRLDWQIWFAAMTVPRLVTMG